MRRGEILAQKRREKGLSVAELAKELGVSEWKIERWEAGELPDSEHLLSLSTALDIPVEDILSGGNEADDKNIKADGTLPPDDEDACETQSEENDDTEDGDDADAIEMTRPLSQSVGIGPSGHNGYYSAERKFGYFVFAVFIIAIIVTSFIQLIGWANRPRELTAENYKDYIEIDITATRHYNPDEYVVRVTAKEDIADLSLSMEVYFSDLIVGDQTYMLVFSGNIEKGSYIERTINLSHFALDSGYKIINISGGLA